MTNCSKRMGEEIITTHQRIPLQQKAQTFLEFYEILTFEQHLQMLRKIHLSSLFQILYSQKFFMLMIKRNIQIYSKEIKSKQLWTVNQIVRN
ncbi:unnamed protein product [Paramecium pentaurelia]|uniref:Uncharacterized protein n=1 Tax=Paramecium pentaurelia TaxID=43138 RepID=A0A8S1T2K6_9CILI|nr:unnamed protein product [Paramecium pentaurelia]